MTNTITKITLDGDDYIVGGGSDIEYKTQAEYNALLPGALTDGKHYFIYTSSVISGYTITGSTVLGNYTPGSFSDIQGCYISPDGTKMYIDFWNNRDGKLAQYSLSTPYDLSNASQVTSISVTQPDAICFSEDGSYFYIGCEQDHTIKRYSMSTAWDISTATQDQSLSLGSGYPYTICLSEDGGYIYYGKENSGSGEFYQYELTTPFDLTTATNVQTITESGIYMIMVKNNGKYLYLSAESTPVTQYELSTPYDIISARTQIGTYTITGANDGRGLWASNDGKYWTFATGSAGTAIRMFEAQPM